MEQPAAGVGSDRMGLVLAASWLRREADAVPDAPDRRPPLFLGNWIAPDGKAELYRLGRYRITPKAFTEVAGRKMPTGWSIVIPAPALTIDLRAAQSAKLDGNELSLLGRTDQLCRQPHGVGYLELTGY